MHQRFRHDVHRDRGNRRPVGRPGRVHHGRGRAHDRHGCPTQPPCVAFALVMVPLPYLLGTDDGYLDAARQSRDPGPGSALGVGHLGHRDQADHHGHPVHRDHLDVELVVPHQCWKKMGCWLPVGGHPASASAAAYPTALVLQVSLRQALVLQVLQHLASVPLALLLQASGQLA